MISLNDGFLPYMNMPTRYIFPAIHIMPENPATSRTSDRHICHTGMPNGMRATITIGDVSGNMEVQNANSPIGSAAAMSAKIIPNIIGKMANDVSCDASWMLSTAEPIDANIDE